ncbi:hypothetical protein ABZ570_14495 [Micromonospora sp. NPDC007271]|uniref:hypothetical protein n=1 Tax=Micromonospora sp. NPDC007271 TaxID=3154587 RepID=UPI0033C860CA
MSTSGEDHMLRSWRRSLLAAALSLTAGAVGLVVSAPASAEPPSGPASGTFALSGDPDDPITRGESFSFTTASGLTAQMYDQFGGVAVALNDPATGVSFYLALASGRDPLAPGTTYTGATRFPYQEGGDPGMIVHGNGATCGDALTGSFTVHDVKFGPYHYVEKLHATFEQHCDGGEPAARGEIDLTNPPAPPLLDPQATVTSGTVVMPDGPVTVQGTLTCGQAATVSVDANAQQDGRIIHFERVEVQCVPGQTVGWTATGTPASGVRFRPGDTQVRVQIQGRDPFYDEFVEVIPPLFPVRLDVA